MMLEGNKQMQLAALQGIERHNKLVIQKGDAMFKPTLDLNKQLEAALLNDHNQIKEDVFVNLFLPYFAGETGPDRPKVTDEHWMGATGDPMKPVDVINSRGQVILMQGDIPLTIPALYNRGALRTMTANRDGNNAATGAIMEETKRYENMGETVVLQVMGKHLSQKAKAATVPGQDIASARQWNRIMAHYGRPPRFIIKGESDAASPSTSPTEPTGTGGDDIYYELP